MTLEEKDLYHCEEIEQQLMAGGKGNTKSSESKKPGEQGVKITVVGRQDVEMVADQEQPKIEVKDGPATNDK